MLNKRLIESWAEHQRWRHIVLTGLFSVTQFSFVSSSLASTHTEPASTLPSQQDLRHRFTSLSVPFEVNAGQFDPQVAFSARQFAGQIFVTRDGKIVHALAGKAPAHDQKQDLAAKERAPRQRFGQFYGSPSQTTPGWTLVESMVNAQPLQPKAGQASPTRVSHFVGSHAKQWATDVSTYHQVHLGEAWPGIQVSLVAYSNNMEKLFTVQPGANALQIRVRMSGAQSLNILDNGILEVGTGNGPVSFTPPVAFQTINGERQTVAVAYRLIGEQDYGFTLGQHDHNKPVVIDPLLAATYVMPEGAAEIYGITADKFGNVFVTGSTQATNFPGTTGGWDPVNSGPAGTIKRQVGVVAKFSGDLQHLLQASYIAGENTYYGAMPQAITTDSNGDVFVTGKIPHYSVGGSLFTPPVPVTWLTRFPALANGAQNTGWGFVTKLSNDLRTLKQSTLIGGASPEDGGHAIALDGQGNVYVVGDTSGDLPSTLGGAQAQDPGGRSAFVSKFSNDLRALYQSTYYGGSSGDYGLGVALDAQNDVFITGWTQSTNLPGVAGNAQLSHKGPMRVVIPPYGRVYDGYDAYVAKFSNDLKTLKGATYIGGSQDDFGNSIAVDRMGDVFVGGASGSQDFPATVGGYQSVIGGSNLVSPFITKLSNDLKDFKQSTHFGTNLETFRALAIGKDSNVYVTGINFQGDVPEATRPYTYACSSCQPVSDLADGFVAKFSNDLKQLHKAAYVTGLGWDQTYAMAIDPNGHIFVAGNTVSTAFPTTGGAAFPSNANPNPSLYPPEAFSGGTGFIVKLSPALDAVDTPAVISSPSPGSTLAESAQLFTWNNANASVYKLEIGSSQGSADVSALSTTGTSALVSGLPSDGRTLYVRLWSMFNGTWYFSDSTFKARLETLPPASSEVLWTGSALTLTSATDPSCQVVINVIEQDNPGQPLRIRYRNGNNVLRETFLVGVSVIQNNQQLFSGHIDVDNANPNENGDRPTFGAFQGAIHAAGNQIYLKMRSCGYKY